MNIYESYILILYIQVTVNRIPVAGGELGAEVLRDESTYGKFE